MIRCENNVAEYFESKESIKVLTDTAETISACGKDIQKAAKTIEIACHTHGTKGAAHKDELLIKLTTLENWRCYTTRQSND